MLMMVSGANYPFETTFRTVAYTQGAANLLLLIPLDVAFPGALIGSVNLVHLMTCMAVILVTSVVIIGQLYRVESRQLLIEPDALLVLLLVISSLVLIYFCK